MAGSEAPAAPRIEGTLLTEAQSFATHMSFGDNARLDADGFAPFGQVTEGMDVVDKLTQGDVMRHVRVWDGTGGAP